MKKIGVACVLSVIGATPVLAQEVSHAAFGLSYSTTKIEGERLGILSGRGELGVQMGTIDLFVSGAYNQLDTSDTPTIEFRDVSFGAGWEFAPGFRGDLSYNNVSLGIGEASASLTFMELGIGYEGENFYGRISYARPNDGLVGLRSLYGAVIGYSLGEELDASISVHFVDERSGELNRPLYIANVSYDAGVLDMSADLASYRIDGVSAQLVSASGAYRFNDDWGMRGSISTASLRETGGGSERITLNRGSLGVDYRIQQTTNLFADLTYTRASVRDSFDSESTSGWGVTAGIRFDLGGPNRRTVTTRDRIDRVLRSVNGF